MFYYQILKKRRLDLNLSVQDIAIQTQLAPEFIRAIEENNLDMFTQDLSYVRYFVHSYADVLGVNWDAIQAEVDGNVEVYARARDQALTQAQRIMAAQMQATAAQKSRSNKKQPKSRKQAKSKSAGSRNHQAATASRAKNTRTVRTKKRPKRKISFFKNSANALSRTLNWNGQDTLSKVAVIGTISLFLIMVALNYVMDSYNARALAAAKEEKQQELLAKEQETQKLANQLQTQKEADAQANGTAPIVTESKNKTNTFFITNVLGVSDEITLSAKSDADPLTLTVQEGDKKLFSQQVDKEYSKTIDTSQETTLEVTLTGYTSSDTIEVSGTPLNLNASGFANGYGKITLQVLYYVPEEPTQKPGQKDSEDKDASTSEQTQDDAQQSAESADPYTQDAASQSENLDTGYYGTGTTDPYGAGTTDYYGTGTTDPYGAGTTDYYGAGTDIADPNSGYYEDTSGGVNYGW